MSSHTPSSSSRITNYARRTFVPFLDDIATYTVEKLKKDVIAALTVAVVSLPQSMAYAVIAGVHPMYGLYSGIFPAIVASLWGSSRFLVSGPTNAISMLLFASLAEVTLHGTSLMDLPEEIRISYVFGVAILAGIVQCIMGFARLGELVHFISHSVIVGFTAGAALLIAAGQLRNLFGLSFESAATFPEQVYRTIIHLPETNWYSLGVGLSTIILILIARRISHKLPGTLLALIIVGSAVALLGLGEHGVLLSGAIPRGFPPFSLPPAPDAEAMRLLFMPALAIALLGTVEALSVAKTLANAKGDTIDASQEFIAQGFAKITAGFTSAIPGSGSFTRSAVSFAAGATTRFAGVFSGIFTLIAILVFAPLAGAIPIAGLAGVLCVMAWGMINWTGIRLSLRATGSDKIVLLATFISTLTLDLEQAVFLGVLLSLALFLRKVSHPQIRKITENPTAMAYLLPQQKPCHHISIYSIEGALFFGAIDELEQRLYEYEQFGHKAVILYLGRVQFIDATGIEAFERFLRKCQEKNVTFLLSGTNPQVQTVLERSGLLVHLGANHSFPTLQEAVTFCHEHYITDAICDACSAKGIACPRFANTKPPAALVSNDAAPTESYKKE